MPIRHILFFLFSVLYGSNSFAQVSRGGTPYTLSHPLKQLDAREILAKPLITSRPILKSSSMGIHHKSITFAEPIKTSYTPDNSGEWFNSKDGMRIWRLSIQSKGAASLNLIFSKYNLPEGAKLFIFSPDGSQVQGAYTSANNKSFGMLPTMPVMGDELMVEYSEPLSISGTADLEIGQVNYDFMGINNVLEGILPGNFGASEICEEEASCYGDWTVERKGVMKIIVDGTELCSGVLMANTSNDNTPFVLSASHCFEDYGYQASTALFIFNYECPNCLSNIEGTREQSIAGGYMRAYSETEKEKDLDYALVEMSIPPPPSYDTYFCGWDIRDNEGKESTTIHHPAGDVKKISMDFDSLGTITLLVDGFKFYPAGHWRIFDWELGVTEGGSSGAPLYNKSHRVMGALSAGSASCESPNDDFFFKLSKAWDAHPTVDQTIKYWLDSDNTGQQFMDGYYPSYGENIQTLSNITSNDSLGVNSFNDAFGKGYQSGDNSSPIHKYAERFTTDDSFRVLGFYFVPFLGKNSVLKPVTFKIWEGEDKPEKELWSQKLVLKEWIRRQRVDGSNFGTSGGFYIKSDYADKECFISIEDDTVIIAESFFIGFEVPELAPEDTFALYQVVNRFMPEDENTSLFFHNDSWKPFTEYPTEPARTAMWICPVVELNSVITDTTPPDNTDKKILQKAFFLQGSDNHLHLELELNEVSNSEIHVELFNLNGQKIYDGRATPLEAKLSLNVVNLTTGHGIYLLRVTESGRQESRKILYLWN